MRKGRDVTGPPHPHRQRRPHCQANWLSKPMSVTAILLVLLSASIHVWWNLLTKQSQSPKGFSLLKGTVLIGVAAVAVVSAPLREIPTNVVIKPSSLEIPLRPTLTRWLSFFHSLTSKCFRRRESSVVHLAIRRCGRRGRSGPATRPASPRFGGRDGAAQSVSHHPKDDGS